MTSPACLLLISSYFLSAAILWCLIHSPIAKYFGDKPDHRKIHQTIIPRMGGLGIILAFLSVLALRQTVAPEIWPRSNFHLGFPLTLTGLFLLGAGTLDDVRALDFKTKFAFQFLLAAVVVIVLGHGFQTITFLGHHFPLHGLGPLLSIFWIVAVMNAMNIIDGIDGLAAGVSLLGVVIVAFMGQANHDIGLVLLCIALIGAIGGFLRFNLSHRDKLFLGDTGSQFLGATMALLAIHVQDMPRNGHSFFVPLLIVGYPLFDIGVAMIRRFKCSHRRGLGKRMLRMFAADNEHLHHRLVYLGLSHVQATFLLVMVAGGISASAIIISRVGWPWRPIVLAYLCVALILILNRLGYLGLAPWLTFPRPKALPPLPVGVVEPDEVFLHSLKSYRQDKFEFLPVPANLTQFLGGDLAAVLLYNAASEKFDEAWTKALRTQEFQDCPIIMIAEAADIERLKSKHPEGFRAVHFMEKPLRIPELMRVLERLPFDPGKVQPRRPGERRFSLAELALRARNAAAGE